MRSLPTLGRSAAPLLTVVAAALTAGVSTAGALDHPSGHTARHPVASSSHALGAPGHTPANPAGVAAGLDYAPASPSAAMTFTVGTAERPLIMEALPPAFAPRTSAHDTPHRVAPKPSPTPTSTVDSTPAAERLTRVLTTAQATRRLSKRCRRLVAMKKPSRLSKTDRSRRSACLVKRRALIAASKKPASSGGGGIAAPKSPAPGPTPATAPTPGTGGPAAPSPTTPAATTPGTGPAPTTPPKPKYTWEACTPAGRSVGLTSYDAFQMYTLTRACAPAGDVTFEFENIDTLANDHNAYIAAVDASGEISGPLVRIAGELPAAHAERTTLRMERGRYLIICTVPGHQGMNTPFQIL